MGMDVSGPEAILYVKCHTVDCLQMIQLVGVTWEAQNLEVIPCSIFPDLQKNSFKEWYAIVFYQLRV